MPPTAVPTPAAAGGPLGHVGTVDGPVVTVALAPGAPPTTAFHHLVAGGTDLAAAHRSGDVLLAVFDPAVRPPPAVGEEVAALGSRLIEPLPLACVDALLAVVAPARDEVSVVDTGIKAVDLHCPIPARGAVVMLGGHGVGRMVFRMELAHRLAQARSAHPDLDVVLVFLAENDDAIGVSDMLANDARTPPDQHGGLRTVWIVNDDAKDPEAARQLPHADGALYFSPLLAARDHFPTLDAVYTASRLLRTDLVGAEQVAVAERVRHVLDRGAHLLADPVFLELVALGVWRRARARWTDHIVDVLPTFSPDDRQTVERAWRLWCYLTQLYSTVEPITGHPGPFVARDRLVADCRTILDGGADDLPPDSLYLCGTLDDARSGQAPGSVRLW